MGFGERLSPLWDRTAVSRGNILGARGHKAALQDQWSGFMEGAEALWSFTLAQERFGADLPSLLPRLPAGFEAAPGI